MSDRLLDRANPARIAEVARAAGCASAAFTYNDPVIFAEYAMEVADACHEAGVKAVAVTAGYMHESPRRAFYAKMDAANVDLKAFTEDFYVRQTGSHLAPVIERDRYTILRYALDETGACRHCGTALAGRFAKAAGTFGARRIPVRLASA